MTSRAALAAVGGLVGVAASLAAVAWAGGPHFSGWAPAQKIDEIAGNSAELNTAALDGCPIESPDGLSLYIASNRPARQAGSKRCTGSARQVIRLDTRRAPQC